MAASSVSSSSHPSGVFVWVEAHNADSSFIGNFCGDAELGAGCVATWVAQIRGSDGAWSHAQGSLLHPSAPAILAKAFRAASSNGVGAVDPRLSRALLSVLDAGRVPLPDILLSEAPILHNKKDSINSTWEMSAPGLIVSCGHTTSTSATASPETSSISTPTNDVISNKFSYSTTTTNATATTAPVFEVTYPVSSTTTQNILSQVSFVTVTVNGEIKRSSLKGGFGACGTADTGVGDVGGDAHIVVMPPPVLLRLLLDDDAILTVEADLAPRAGGLPVPARGYYRFTNGNDNKSTIVIVTGLTLQVATNAMPWLSLRSFASYTPELVLRTAEGAVFNILPAMRDSEVVTLPAAAALWFGRVDAQLADGCLVPFSIHGRTHTKGVGSLTLRPGYRLLSNLDLFFKSVGAATRAAVVAEYPDQLTEAKAAEMYATLGIASASEVAGADLNALHAGLVAPIRHLVDAGGKSWRSYGLLAACDAVGGDSRKWSRFLALAELLHVGSLVIDDVQDASELRRGVAAAHVVFGVPAAVNAGTAAYFHCERIITRGGLPPESVLQILEQYFGLLRAGHAGQALDIGGLEGAVETALQISLSEDARALAITSAELRLLATHRLKTGVPAASLVRIGAILGGAPISLVKALGAYQEAVGVAFQIMDDVLNLRGIYSGKSDKAALAGVQLKVLGEDVTAGKATFPIILALSRLPREEMTRLWADVKAKPTDAMIVSDVIARLEACGAIDACVARARTIVEEGFAEVDALLPDSMAKIM